MTVKNIIIFIIILSILGGGFFIYNSNNKHDKKKIIQSNTGNLEILEENKEIIIEVETKKDKISGLRKRLALKGLILKGDINYNNDDYTNALVKYLKIHKEIPDDKSIINKLGNVYYDLKKYKKAYSYYTQIKNYEQLNKEKMIFSLFTIEDFNEENITIISDELKTINLTKDEQLYYKNSLICISDFSSCRKNFQDYFDNKNKIIEEKKEGTGSLEEIIEEISFYQLDNIEKAFINYDNFQVDDLMYKGALITGAYYENGFYPMAIQTAKNLLKEKSDYKPIIKIIAKSYFEIGNYVKAKIYLIMYNKLVDDDAEVSYFLGVIYEKLHDYLLSNIHFKKSIKLGFYNPLDVNKRILFNYYQTGNIDKMLATFEILINKFSAELTINDYNLAIYYNIVNEKYKKAKKYTIIALKQYPKSEIFNGYMGWLIMEDINKKSIINNELTSGTGTIDKNEDNENKTLYSEAERYIDIGLELNNKSPMINLVKGKLEANKGNTKKAFIYFKKTFALDNNGDFGKMAKQELDNINMNK